LACQSRALRLLIHADHLRALAEMQQSAEKTDQAWVEHHHDFIVLRFEQNLHSRSMKLEVPSTVEHGSKCHQSCSTGFSRYQHVQG
jgi:hypothetical protein